MPKIETDAEMQERVRKALERIDPVPLVSLIAELIRTRPTHTATGRGTREDWLRRLESGGAE